MRRAVHRFFFLALVALAAVPLAIACGQEAVSIPDPEAPEVGPGVDSGDGGAGDTGAQDASDAPVTCADVLPDDSAGIYVTPTGTNSGTCGTRAAPCKTINFSINRAGVALRSKVYAARGTYVEKVALAAGVEVIGGWDVVGTTWKRACVSPEQIVVLRAPSQNITVEARDLGGEARLSTLTVETKSPAQVIAGESLYGVVAVGATTTLVMTDVDVETGAAGAGADGTKGGAGVDGGPSCPTGTGTVGTAGTQGAGAPGGTYDPATEYTPGVALPGGGAGAGGDGTTGGGVGACVNCGTCTLNLLMMACDFTPNGTQNCGKEGTTGCGGGPGAPGEAATGGGTSIGVFAWDASVTINGGKVKSGDGGNGGLGGAGGAGGAASRGAVGASSDLCVTGCTFAAAACTDVKTRGAGGAAGGNGAAGGVGGAGGGGGGGSSFAIYQGGAGLVTTAAGASLSHGKAGKGGTPVAGMGAAGAAADRVP